MLKIMLVLGTRPEVIKMAPILQELRRHRERVEARVCVTAQHRELLDQALALFGVRPDIDLDLMRPGQTLPELTSRILLAMTDVLIAEQPDWVLVQGDTTTVFAASVAAFYQRIPVGHVEAGLRTGDINSPFPEEMNRKAASVLATLHFAPTPAAAAALRAEGVPANSIFCTGNTVIDALLWVVGQPPSANVAELFGELGLALPGSDGNGSTRNADPRQTILVTAHRRESFGAPFESLCHGLLAVAERNSRVRLIYPVHPNPQVREPVSRILAGHERIFLTPPLPYDCFAHLMKAVDLILTDSGGIQEEAPALGKPVLILRDTTERPEAVAAGAAKVIGTDADRIVAEVERLLGDSEEYRQMSHAVSPFGDGKAAERIVRAILETGARTETTSDRRTDGSTSAADAQPVGAVRS